MAINAIIGKACSNVLYVGSVLIYIQKGLLSNFRTHTHIIGSEIIYTEEHEEHYENFFV